MPSYTAPITDMQFVLHTLLQADQQSTTGYEEMSPDMTQAILEEAGKLASDVLAPLNLPGDREGCHFEANEVRTPQGFGAAFDQLKEGGWTGLDCDPAYGGQGMPYLMGTAVGEIFSAANQSFTMYQGLTHGAYSAIHAHGTEAQKATYLPKMVSCEWTGTMNLTEPHCGTDLGLMRTKAEPKADGSYAITGQKIFISAGEHDLAENIIHLVLAKIPGGPEGIKGVSLFIVPKFLVQEDGSLGARNGVSCGAIEEKMGIHGNATCVMNYDGATGYLLGEAHKGMRAMFTMMNEARIGVAMQGLAQAEAAYQNARIYATERLQGRAITGAANPDGPADPLIVHPDVRRMLMEQKSFVEGARALLYYGAQLIDQSHRSGDAAAEAMVSLLTPVLKGFLTDMGFEMCVKAQQIYGGHGYIEEWGMSQFVRDARIAMIYEGANGVQALDLVGRKLGANGGQTVMTLLKEIGSLATLLQEDDKLGQAFALPLQKATNDLQKALGFMMQEGTKNPNAALSGATDLMHLMGHVMLGYVWTKMAKAASETPSGAAADQAFLEAKITTGAFYMARMLPATGLHLRRILSGAEPVMQLRADQF